MMPPHPDQELDEGQDDGSQKIWTKYIAEMSQDWWLGSETVVKVLGLEMMFWKEDLAHPGSTLVSGAKIYPRWFVSLGWSQLQGSWVITGLWEAPCSYGQQLRVSNPFLDLQRASMWREDSQGLLGSWRESQMGWIWMWYFPDIPWQTTFFSQLILPLTPV